MMKTGFGSRDSGFAKAVKRRHSTRSGLLAVAACVMLAGCSILGGGNERDRATIYAPDPRVTADPSWPTADWQLSLSPPSAARAIDSFRIAVRPTPDELQVYKGASWAKTPTDMLQDALLRALEDSGRIRAVARQGTGVAADYKLVMDLRRFDADYAGAAAPAATIEVNVKLLHAVDQNIVAQRTFLRAEPAAGTDVAQVADAFSRSLGTIAGEIAGWVLVTGNEHEQSAHPQTADVVNR
jgi:cholesterol transport system auxiliary component